MPKDVAVCFPEKQSLGSLYVAERTFPHLRKWVGEARGKVVVQLEEGRMLGVALGSLGWEGLANTGDSDLSLLMSLDVSTCHFSERSFASATNLAHLAEMRLDYLKIGDSEVRLLRRFSNLKTLWLTGTEITDGGVREFKELPQIENIVLKSTAVSDQGIANMGEIASLRCLNLPAQITDRGLEFLKNFPALTRLDLSFTRVTNEGMKQLSTLPELHELYLNDTTLGDDGLAYLQHLKSLTSLFLSGTRVSDSGLNHFDSCSQLEHLELRDTRATEIGVARLRSKLPNCAIFGP
ncbi:MAG TPA: hypothetical protein V6C89_12260 [Drouetiella sp.]|jgi:internalin A